MELKKLWSDVQKAWYQLLSHLESDPARRQNAVRTINRVILALMLASGLFGPFAWPLLLVLIPLFLVLFRLERRG